MNETIKLFNKILYILLLLNTFTKSLSFITVCKKKVHSAASFFAVGCSKIHFINTFSLFYAFWISIYLDL